MKGYPYFYPEAALLLIALSLAALPLILHSELSFATGVAGASVFGLYLIQTVERAGSFDSSLRKIRGFERWESDFSSIGALRLWYEGMESRFESVILPGRRHIRVDYCLSFACGCPQFEIRRGSNGFLVAEGSLEAASRIRSHALAFDRRYPLDGIVCRAGRLALCVGLDFEKGGTGFDGKEKDLGAFMGDFLEFAKTVRASLKRPYHAPRLRHPPEAVAPKPRKRIRKRT